MKKYVLLAISLFVIFTLTGCEELPNDNNKHNTIYSINETVTHKNINYTVTDISYSKGQDWDVPTEGNKYIIISLDIQNNSEQRVYYNIYDWKIANNKGQEEEPTFTSIDKTTRLNDGHLMPNGTKTGTILFEVSENDEILTLHYYENELISNEPDFRILLK